MDGNKVLVLDDVSVRYRKQDSRSTADIVRRLLGKSPRSNEFWALRNISFSLEKGEMLGVIGKNGAGKSTMMKAISGTLTGNPSSATIYANELPQNSAARSIFFITSSGVTGLEQ